MKNRKLTFQSGKNRNEEELDDYIRNLIQDANKRIRLSGNIGFIIGLIAGLGAFLFLK